MDKEQLANGLEWLMTCGEPHAPKLLQWIHDLSEGRDTAEAEVERLEKEYEFLKRQYELVFRTDVKDLWATLERVRALVPAWRAKASGYVAPDGWCKQELEAAADELDAAILEGGDDG